MSGTSVPTARSGHRPSLSRRLRNPAPASSVRVASNGELWHVRVRSPQRQGCNGQAALSRLSSARGRYDVALERPLRRMARERLRGTPSSAIVWTLLSQVPRAPARAALQPCRSVPPAVAARPASTRNRSRHLLSPGARLQATMQALSTNGLRSSTRRVWSFAHRARA